MLSLQATKEKIRTDITDIRTLFELEQDYLTSENW